MCKKLILVRIAKRYLPCGQCVECRMERARVWAVRLMHESTLHDASCFITLTYEKEPDGGQLQKSDIQKFIKLLRKTTSIRYYISGEYAPATFRPHYHGILYGKSLSQSELEAVWKKGFVSSSSLTFSRANYVAKYTLKDTSYEFEPKVKPFALMSRNPGIGYGVIEKITSPKIYSNGHQVMVPRYYQDKLFQTNFRRWLEIEDEKYARSRKRFNKVMKERKLDIDYDVFMRSNMNPIYTPAQYKQDEKDALAYQSLSKSKVR